MYLYLKSEILKTKRTNIRKILLMIPLLCSLLALGFNFLSGDPEIISLSAETIINHWGILWISVFIALTTGLLNNLERKSTNYKTIIALPINLQKKEMSRVLLVTGFAVLGSLLIIVAISLTSLLIQTSPYLVPLFSCFLAVILMFVTSLWQIPFCLWLSRKTNFFITLLLNSMLNLSLGAFFAPTEDWWFIPYSWHLRVQMPLTHLHSNGIPLPQNDELLSYSAIPIALVLSILFFIVLTLITVRSFNKIEVK
ncbi:lantibiotic immunity ABC transporter MutE/EpiE family permease subunit [Bacillus sp. FJAT-50079]|uniref:lantibiotic immunity ABC transporter MutE/EpiE family permease subunit n=1 Tax=Bacillus sp. FJAT-50079 TaxID=2833577 RepID=UPI001BCA386E|nr:lantibiotic immunity ABC transporter MutE/EpiE family permease subunit [Bacillus sp. FJAT-50079]MBS4207230.1 lantibiotic immunity ABC transporter MutE/EpiE family permease subunit [Bacillus sp. FJAT-50079]